MMDKRRIAIILAEKKKQEGSFPAVKPFEAPQAAKIPTIAAMTVKPAKMDAMGKLKPLGQSGAAPGGRFMNLKKKLKGL